MQDYRPSGRGASNEMPYITFPFGPGRVLAVLPPNLAYTMKKIVVLTGAGISAESGLKTFRDAGGLWEGHDVFQVATPEGFARDPELVLRFYNERRHQANLAQPNPAHHALVQLEAQYDVQVITQNVDDLHERAGSRKVLHLHGELNKARSVMSEHIVIEVRDDINLGDMGPDGHQLRPHIVWFGEPVPNIIEAARLISDCDMVMIVGTSMVVYPAAGLIDYAPLKAPVFVVDPGKPEVQGPRPTEFLVEKASTGVPRLVERLLAKG